MELNLGELHCNLAVMKRDPALFDTATAHLDAALEVFIANGNARYQRYTENLAESVEACEPSEIDRCVCGGYPPACTDATGLFTVLPHDQRTENSRR